MPSHSRAAAINLDEAKELSELYGIQHDLELAHALVGLVIRSKEVNEDIFMVEGLISAAIVRYGRCFKTGVRAKFKEEWLQNLDDEMKGMHQYFMDLRDKYIAHSVNAYEDSYVTATVTVKDGEMLPISALHSGHQRVVLSAGEAQALNDLMFSLRSIIESHIEIEKNKLLSLLQILSIEKQHSFQLREPIAAKIQDVAKKRKQR